ncbi:MAG: sigma 54-interacting transcriptional regulator [Pseudomonadota bacterium]|nr:sigma 54-interacting transcriptional regulator [Pseudomonadota bacterium]
MTMTVAARILLVDDDPALLRLLSLRLENANYEVATAASGEQALVVLESSRPQLVITDLRMDGMDGLALFEAIRARHPLLPVIVLTAHGSIPDAVAATQRGVAGFLTKPFDSQALLEQVRRALAAGGGTLERAAGDDWRREILCRSGSMETLLEQVRRVAGTEASVLIEGQSGTGKELLARAIHNASSRATRPFVAVNCGAIPESLLESELFGHRRGAFTGATRDHEGLFAAADGGSIFLDEIGDMPAQLQVKLLRVLQEREVRPVGETRARSIDVRVISATHRDLDQARSGQRFREDLFYRLGVVRLRLPALAERREDIPLLAEHFRAQMAAQYGKEVTGFAPAAMERLLQAPWSGNVRELRNVVEQLVALADTPVLTDAAVRQALQADSQDLLAFAEARRRFERRYLAELLQMTGGSVSQAARLAKRNRTEFYKLLHRHGLDPDQFRENPDCPRSETEKKLDES